MQFLGEQLDDAADAALAGGRQAVGGEAADDHGRRAEGECEEDVGAGADAAVEQDRDAAGDLRRDLGQHVEAGRGRVDLAAAVVGDEDRRRAGADGRLRRLGGEDALGDPRQAVAGGRLGRRVDVPEGRELAVAGGHRGGSHKAHLYLAWPTRQDTDITRRSTPPFRIIPPVSFRGRRTAGRK